MRAVDYSLAVRDFLYAVHKNGAFALEFFDDKAIVDNFFAHINRRTEGFKSNSDDINCPHHAGAKAARL